MDEHNAIERTIAVYNAIAKDYVARTLCPNMDEFPGQVAAMVPPAARLLDVGMGSGRHAITLTEKGFDVDALEPSHALAADFRQRHPDFDGTIFPTTIEYAHLPANHYDAIYACASLLHVPIDLWPISLNLLRQAAKPNGLLFISVKQQKSGFDAEGRWFTGFDHVAALRHAVEATNAWQMTHSAITADSLGRNVRWLETWFAAR